ncbi:MAG: GNAT family N-acetyltransferase [Steroidobacteraceae bacterium]
MHAGDPFDNPMWSALTGRQQAFALGAGAVRRYPRDVAPFVAVEGAGVQAARDLDAVVDPGEAVYVVAVAPAWPPGWEVIATGTILQMHCTRALSAASADWAVLGHDDLPAMLELTALVYPEFFRERTPGLGRYLGIRQGGALAAMAGERIEIEGHVEISAVCTHPDHTGHGYAARLTTALAGAIEARGARPFLHVSDHNQRAIDLYARLGFIERARLPLWKVRRARQP